MIILLFVFSGINPCCNYNEASTVIDQNITSYRAQQNCYLVVTPMLVATVTVTVSHHDSLAITTDGVGTNFLSSQFAGFTQRKYLHSNPQCFLMATLCKARTENLTNQRDLLNNFDQLNLSKTI